MPFSLSVRVYIEDTDAGGIVYYVNYLKYFERVRTEFLRHLGFDQATMIEQGRLFIVQRANVRYRQAACLDDRLDVSAVVKQLGHSRVVFEQQVMKDGVCLAEAEIWVGCVDRETRKPSRLPEAIREAFAGQCSN